MSCASSSWQGAGLSQGRSPFRSRRGLEVVGVVFAFFWFWPVAAAYVAWKLLGYPGLEEVRATFDRSADQVRGFAGQGFGGQGFGGGPFAGSGNAAFDDYRRAEIERLEAERRRLDEEAREFRSFVHDLKKAKDREEFDAYMARRRQNGPTSV